MPSITYKYLLISLLIVENLCNNTTGRFYTMDSKKLQSKEHRLLSFNTQDNGDISMELAFNVPFITIPVKKSIDMAHGAIANVNIGAIVLAGGIIFGFAVLIPGILLLMSKKMFGPATSTLYRSEDSQQWWEYISLLDQLLTENDIDTTSCLQRMICWTVKNSAENVVLGQSSSGDKIIDGLATNEWLKHIVKGTVIQSALESGLGRADCLKKYQQCKISEKSLKLLTNKVADVVGTRRH